MGRYRDWGSMTVPWKTALPSLLSPSLQSTMHGPQTAFSSVSWNSTVTAGQVTHLVANGVLPWVRPTDSIMVSS